MGGVTCRPEPFATPPPSPLRSPPPTPTVKNEEQPTWAPAAPGSFFGSLWTGAPNFPPHFPHLW